MRENGESIALIGGEPEERAGLDASLRNVLRRWRDVCFQTMRTTIVYQGSGILAPVFPVILCAPKFLDGSMSLGQVMQAASAFVIVQQAFSWLVDNYPRFADWTASARRVASLLVSLDTLDQAEEAGVGHIERGETDGAALRLDDLSVTLDDGTVVVNEAEVEIAPGEKVLVVGESGTGKSSLVRAIAGLWPWGGGKLAAPIRRAPVHAAAAALHPDRHATARRHLSERRGRRRRPRRSPRRWRMSALAISSSGSTRRSTGTRPCRAARSSASPSRASWCRSPTSS